MRDFAGKTYWLVGASEGLGAALAEKLSDAGAEVILSARSEARLNEVATRLNGPSRVVPMDVSDAKSVAKAAKDVGDIDGMVYLAGVYWPMHASAWDSDQVLTMMDINVMGAARVLGNVVPQFLAKDAGHIVITGSLSGFRGLPSATGYGASKAAVMHMAESLRVDMRRSNVAVQLVNPGFIRTRLTDKNNFAMPFIMAPASAADIFLRHMRRKKFSCSFPWSFGAFFRVSQFFPDWLYYRIF